MKFVSAMLIALLLLSLDVSSEAFNSTDVPHHKRIVNDILRMDIGALISPSSDAPYILIQIQPTATSGRRFDGVYEDPTTGQPVITKEKITVIHQGTIKIDAVLRGNLPDQEQKYEWKQPVSLYDKYVLVPFIPDSPYASFTQSNSAVAQVNKGDDISRFNPVYLIPPEWTKFVIPAVEFYKQYPNFFDRFDPPKTADNKDQLLKLVENDNPFLSIAAARGLMRLYDLKLITIADLSGLEKVIEDSRDFKQAALTAVMLSRLPKDSVSGASGIVKFIDGADSSAMFEGIALGALVAGDTRFGGRRHIYISNQSNFISDSILQKIDEKQKALATSTEADRYINAVLRAGGRRITRKEIRGIGTSAPK